jgi:hypothetical protein
VLRTIRAMQHYRLERTVYMMHPLLTVRAHGRRTSLGVCTTRWDRLVSKSVRMHDPAIPLLFGSDILHYYDNKQVTTIFKTHLLLIFSF